MCSEMTKKIWTIGHSTHPFDEFLFMLQSFNIELVADIRSYPGSKKFPQFNMEALKVSLHKNKIQYVHLKTLGGRRKENNESKNTTWRHPAFRGYADYMETRAFKEGLGELKSMASEKRTVYMCSEAVWWRCHRSMVSDALKADGWEVMHIMGIEKAQEHPYMGPAKVKGNGVSYRAETFSGQNS